MEISGPTGTCTRPATRGKGSTSRLPAIWSWRASHPGSRMLQGLIIGTWRWQYRRAGAPHQVLIIEAPRDSHSISVLLFLPQPLGQGKLDKGLIWDVSLVGQASDLLQHECR